MTILRTQKNNLFVSYTNSDDYFIFVSFKICEKKDGKYKKHRRNTDFLLKQQQQIRTLPQEIKVDIQNK